MGKAKPFRPLYREDLDLMQCATPGCDHTGHDCTMFFHGRCHPHAATWSSYDASSGWLLVVCAECGANIACVAVAHNTYD